MPHFLFILESVGTTELLLIGIVALMLLGPRRMPEMAKKLAKIMAEFRGTANEFKETWQKEIDLEEEAKALDINRLDSEVVARKSADDRRTDEISQPNIKQLDPADFELMAVKTAEGVDDDGRINDEPEYSATESETADVETSQGGKESWL